MTLIINAARPRIIASSNLPTKAQAITLDECIETAKAVHDVSGLSVDLDRLTVHQLSEAELPAELSFGEFATIDHVAYTITLALERIARSCGVKQRGFLKKAALAHEQAHLGHSSADPDIFPKNAAMNQSGPDEALLIHAFTETIAHFSTCEWAGEKKDLYQTISGLAYSPENMCNWKIRAANEPLDVGELTIYYTNAGMAWMDNLKQEVFSGDSRMAVQFAVRHPPISLDEMITPQLYRQRNKL